MNWGYEQKIIEKGTVIQDVSGKAIVFLGHTEVVVLGELPERSEGQTIAPQFPDMVTDYSGDSWFHMEDGKYTLGYDLDEARELDGDTPFSRWTIAEISEKFGLRSKEKFDE